MGRDLSSGRRKDGRTDDDQEGMIRYRADDEGMIETIYLGERGWPGTGAEPEGRTGGEGTWGVLIDVGERMGKTSEERRTVYISNKRISLFQL